MTPWLKIAQTALAELQAIRRLLEQIRDGRTP